MKREDLNLHNLISADEEDGIVKFLGHRIILFDAVIMGILRKELINTIGVAATRHLLTRLGYAHGWLTAHNLDSEYPELLQDPGCATRLHALEGVVNVKELKIDGDPKNCRFTVFFENSYEAEQHILQVGMADQPVCWSLIGYVSGYISRMHGREAYCVEHKCVGKGDAYCFIECRPKDEWGKAFDDQLLFFQKETIDGALKDVTTRLRKAERRLSQLQRLLESDILPPGILARSKPMLQVLDLARRAAKVDTSVVVTGESGTGKELVARFIHDESMRSGKPFIAVNCSAIPETLLESEFFGHVKGAFTGADRDRVGLIEAANGGTIFLDEISEMPLGMQAKLLRALQEKKIRRVGETASRPIDFRVICATNRNLEEEVAIGRFRQDLYYRLCVIEIAVPPLRDRTDDILPLASFYLKKVKERIGRPVEGFSTTAVDHLLLHNWPGNVRELQNVIERTVALCPGNVIQVEDLPYSLRKAGPKPDSDRDIHPLAEIEKKYVLTALQMAKGNKRLAAEKLGISLPSLYRRLKEYG